MDILYQSYVAKERTMKNWKRWLGLPGGVLILILTLNPFLQRLRAPERETAAEEGGRPYETRVRAVGAVGDAPAASAAEQTERREGVYTFLLAGQDNGNGNTDTLTVVRLDTAARSLDAVFIPRDTMVNSDWRIKKINAAYSMGLYDGSGGAACLARHVEGLTGFPADSYAVIDISAFVRAVDAMGGVWFDVPMAMDYEDPSQNLAIHLRPGYQLLSGQQAIGLCRFRSGYPTADLGRIEMQQRFLKACAAQFASVGNIPNMKKVVEILADKLETDMSAGKIAWFLVQALRCPSENIRFHTAPNQVDTVDGYSYTILELEPWLELINSCLNPYTRPITAQDLDVIYAADGQIRCTGEARFVSGRLAGDAREAAVPAQRRTGAVTVVTAPAD